MKFMKFIVETLFSENITFIRDSCLEELINFMGYVPHLDYNRVSDKLFDLFAH